MINGMVRWLQDVDDDLSAREMADILWLTLEQQRRTLISDGERIEEPNLGIEEPTNTGDETDVLTNLTSDRSGNSRADHRENIANPLPSNDATQSPPSIAPQPVAYLTTQSPPAGLPPRKTLPFKTPAAPALRHPLLLARSLRSLKRRYPSPTRRRLDPVATVCQILEQDLWTPVLKPEMERWFSLTVVIEVSLTMDIWRSLLDEWLQLVKHHGAFRNVRCWRLSGVSPSLELAASGANPPVDWHLSPDVKAGGVPQRPNALLEPGGRQLIVVVSDAVSLPWQRGEMYDLLAGWNRRAAVSVMQVMPESHWSRTVFGRGVLTSLVARQPEPTHSRLALPVWPDWMPPLNERTALKLPVFVLERRSLQQWATAMMGNRARVAGVVFADGETMARARLGGMPSAMTGEERVQRFRAIASRPARRLASLLAAAPVSLSIAQLIQQTMLPESGPLHLSEVWLGGLINLSVGRNRAGEPQYDFFSDVRDTLLDGSTVADADEVLDRVSNYIARRAGYAIKSFDALLALYGQGGTLDDRARQEIQAFAEVAPQVLRRLGGVYRDIADELETLSVTVTAEGIVTPVVLMTHAFTTATLEPLMVPDGIPSSLATGEAAMSPEDDLGELPHPGGDVRLYPWVFETARLVGDRVERWQAMAYGFTERLPAVEGLDEVMPRHQRHQWEQQLQGLVRMEEQVSREAQAADSSQGQARIEQQWQDLQDRMEELEAQIRYAEEQIIQDVPLEMVAIPGGTFHMGSSEAEKERYSGESPQHEVRLSGFLISHYPITQAQWRAVATLPKVDLDLDPDPAHFKGADRPVERVSWYEVTEFCARLSAATQRDYRLPTEAEWEYACRAGTTTPFAFGETLTSELANYNNQLEETTPVGRYPANAWGLCDMHGNVWEWCADHWHGSYREKPEEQKTNGNIPWPKNNQDSPQFVLRGGSWIGLPGYCRSAFRNDFNPDARYADLGFRVVCSAARTLP